MPGGIGGEVGIYRTIPGKRVPDELALPRIDEFPAIVRPVVKKLVSRIIKDVVETAEAGVDWWWPYPELNVPIEMRLVTPDHKTELFTADPIEKAGGYGMSRWMHYDSYKRFVAHEALHGNPMPNPYDFHMDFAVGGKWFHWGPHDYPITPK